MAKQDKKFEDMTPEEQSKFVAELISLNADYEAKLQLGNDNYQKLLGELESEKEAHKISNSKSLEVITELKKQIELKDVLVKAGSKVVISHKKKNYTVEINSFKLDGQVYNAKDLQEKPELIEKLLKLGSSVISESTE